MDESRGAEATPTLDESFVAGAEHREPSHRERQLDNERRLAEERIRRYRAELEAGYQARIREGRQSRSRRRGDDDAWGNRPHRTRQAVGIVITVVVLVVAFGAQYVPIGRTAHIGLVPSPPTDCAPGLYPSGSQYRFERCSAGQPIGWPRCTTLSVTVDPTNAPSGWSDDVANSLAELTQATALRFQTSSEGGGDITIGWSTVLLAPSGSARDEAGVTRTQVRTSTAGAEISSADIQLSTRLVSGSGRNGEVPVLLHELGHAAGLGHYTGPVVMNPVDQGYPSYQSGDLAGLAQLYRPSGCS